MQFGIWFYVLISVSSSLVVSLAAWLIVRQRHTNRLRQELERPFEELNRTPKSKLPPELAILSGLSTWDAFFSISNLNPDVLKAIDLSSSKDLSSLYNQILFALDKKHFQYLYKSKRGRDKVFDRLKGFVGEEESHRYHEERGWNVEPAEKSNQPEWDAKYDGAEVQIKTLKPESAGKVREHFKKSPHTPVSGNEELESEFQNDPNINLVRESEIISYEGLPPNTVVIRSLSEEGASEHLHETLGDLASIGYFHGIPIMTAGFSLSREASLWMQGKTDIRMVSEHVGVDVVARASGAKVGGSVGAIIGDYIGGKPGAMAGSSLGAIAGMILSRQAGGWFKGRHLRAAQERYIAALKKAGISSPEAIEYMLYGLSYKKTEYVATASKSNIFKRIFWPDTNDILFGEIKARYNSSIKQTRLLLKRVNKLLKEDNENGAIEAGKLVVFGGIQINHPPLNECVGELISAHDDILMEMRKLGLDAV